MRILAIDIGMGTQDILIYNGDNGDLENAFKLVLPSPTSMYADIVRKSNEDLVIYGDTMGGGPFSKAVIEHIRVKKRRVYMTEDAARTIRDDLNVVRRYGIEIISEDEVEEIRDAKKIRISDFNTEILRFLGRMGVIPRGCVEDFDVVAIAVQDHGVAPEGVSDRENRFRFLSEKIGSALFEFAFVNEVPPSLSRMRSVLNAVKREVRGRREKSGEETGSDDKDVDVLLMDTGAAAALGVFEDERVRGERSVICVNVGNAHTVAFSVEDGIVKGIFEHHMYLLNRDKLREYLRKLADGSITNEEVFNDGGHGAVVIGSVENALTALTGPKRAKMRGIGFFASPAGDMMMTGAVGLVKAALNHHKRANQRF